MVEESVEAVVGAWVLIMTVSAGLSHHFSACLPLLCWSCSPVSVTVSVQVIGKTLRFFVVRVCKHYVTVTDVCDVLDTYGSMGKMARWLDHPSCH